MFKVNNKDTRTTPMASWYPMKWWDDIYLGDDFDQCRSKRMIYSQVSHKTFLASSPDKPTCNSDTRLLKPSSLPITIRYWDWAVARYIYAYLPRNAIVRPSNPLSKRMKYTELRGLQSYIYIYIHFRWKYTTLQIYISTEAFQNFSSVCLQCLQESVEKLQARWCEHTVNTPMKSSKILASVLIYLLFLSIWNFYINIVIACNLLYIYIYIYIYIY